MTFKDAGLHPVMLRNVELAGYQVPTPIQKYCLPAIAMGHDVIAIAQTGISHPSCTVVVSCTDYVDLRLGKDGGLSDSHSEQTDGQGQKARSPSPQPGYLPTWNRPPGSC